MYLNDTQNKRLIQTSVSFQTCSKNLNDFILKYRIISINTYL
jgi:hypothetical protein